MPTFLALVLAYSWITEGQRPTLVKHRRQLIPLSGVFLVYLTLRMNAIGSFLDQRQLRYESLSVVQVLLNQTYLLCKYIKLFFLPYALNAHHLFEPIWSPFDPRFVISFIASGLLCFCFMKARLGSSLQGKMTLFGLCWFVITLSPVLIFIKRIGENLFAER